MTLPLVHLSRLVWFAGILGVGLWGATAWSQDADSGFGDEPSEASMGAYADAANFQTGGAIELAIDGWKQFLRDYPDHPMASKAAHYLGVCHMQSESPDYAAASEAFGRALKDDAYDLREESLANAGWCWYASAGEGEDRDQARLKKSLQTFQTLREEFPKSRFLDRATFYCGEAAYGLGQPANAIEYYDELLAMPNVKESPLRCDALYARGVAQEDLDKFDDALATYKQLLSNCDQSDLATDVHLRLGDLAILRKEFDGAVASFDQAIASTEDDEDLAYAIFRQAFALVQSDRPAEAAAKYETLLTDYPKSPYAASATLASAQSVYRSGDIDEAAKRFRKVLDQNNPAAATEAAHWLARIAIDRGKPADAIEIANAQIKRGLGGEFEMDVKLDLAEALSLNPKTIPKSLEIFEAAYRESPQSPLASRALYNAAFSALQIGDPTKALSLATEFLKKFPGDTLTPDVRFVSAEGQLLTGKVDEAAKTYRDLIASTRPGNIQRPVWLLRAATTSNASGKYDETIKLLSGELDSLTMPAQKADANLLIGNAHLMAKRPDDAAAAFAAAVKADPTGPRADEAALMVGQARLVAGDAEQAVAAWNAMIQANATSRMADQARYKLAQVASTNGQYERAIEYFDQILSSDRDPGLQPYAQYGKAFANLQAGKYDASLTDVETMLDRYPDHPLASEATLTRGIVRRNLKQYDTAREDLETFLSIPPRGTNLGHALYELALVDQAEKQPAKAAEHLQRLVDEVPGYPAMDKVLYELGWSMQESGQDEAAMKHFQTLVNDYPDAAMIPEATYFLGQRNYVAGDWDAAAKQFERAAETSTDESLSEKALYRLGWSHFKTDDFKKAEAAFANQAEKHPNGRLSFDAMMMVGESRFSRGDYKSALAGFEAARLRIEANDETSTTIRDAAERQVRELTLLHGGQSAAQLNDWDAAIDWYAELRNRFPTSDYLPQVFYETGFAYQQKGDSAQALKFFGEVADNYRNETAARARFMMGEIHFADRKFDLAIPEFQRVMFGFGAEDAPDAIKNWQAKSGFEAGRCSELLAQASRTPTAKEKANAIATKFFKYVVEKHPEHELADQSNERLETTAK